MNSTQNSIYSLEKSFYSRSTYKDIYSLRNSLCSILSMHTVIFGEFTLSFLGEILLFYTRPVQTAIQSQESSPYSILSLYKNPFNFWRIPNVLFLTCTESHLISGVFSFFYFWPAHKDFWIIPLLLFFGYTESLRKTAIVLFLASKHQKK